MKLITHRVPIYTLKYLTREQLIMQPYLLNTTIKIFIYTEIMTDVCTLGVKYDTIKILVFEVTYLKHNEQTDNTLYVTETIY